MTLRIRIALACSGWMALAATLLPAASPLRTVVLAAFLVCCPGAAAARPALRGPDRLEGAVLSVAVSLALGLLVAEGYFLAHAFTLSRAIATLAALTSVLALRPGRGRGGGSRAWVGGRRASRGHPPGPPRPPRAWRVALALALLGTAACGAGGGGSGLPSTAGSPASASSPPIEPAGPGSWHPVFQDGFDGSALDQARWATCYDWNVQGCTNAGNNELEWYLPGQVTVGGGQATLSAVRRATPGSDGKSYPWTSGMITTGRDSWNAQPRETFTYGYFAAALRIPAEGGMFPAFWLMPASRHSPPELDVAEFSGTTQQVDLNVHWPGPDGGDRNAGSSYGPVDFPAATHVFALDWEPGSLTWYVDGVQRWQQTDPGRIPAVPMELVVNLAVGYPSAPPNSVNSGALAVDWVKVWQH